MFARNVSVRLKPNTLAEFTKIFENEVLPTLKKQPGFRDELAFSGESGNHVIAISLWDTKEQADAYERAAFPGIVKALDKVLDGPPKVRPQNVLHTTLPTAATVAV
jgi:heme-degrading monooxygenase HmoA